MVNIENKSQDLISAYKMTEDERLDITNQLKDAIEVNKAHQQKSEWDSKTYRDKYGV